MKITKTGFDGLLIIEPAVNSDSRGYFLESYNKRVFGDAGIDFDVVQENQSYSKKNVIRGLHFQRAPHAQTKLVRVVQGRILDVVVDLRKNQPTYKNVFSTELSSGERKHLLIPKGFAHGYSVLSEGAEIIYCCDDVYKRESEAGVLHNDPALSIDWRVPEPDRIVSEKDLLLPTLASLSYNF